MNRLPTAVSLGGSMLLSSAFVLAAYFRNFTLHIERRWHALSAGVAVAYVFVNIMPELEEHRPAVAGSAVGSNVFDIEKRIYAWALAGFIVFAGLSRLRSAGAGPRKAALLYWGEMGGYALYTLLIGYLLVRREDDSMLSLCLFVFAIGLHLFMMDGELTEQFGNRYEPRGRLLLLCCVLIGWALGIADAFPDSFTSRLFAFLAGGVLISSIHEEVGAVEGQRFWWFVGGAAFYSTLLMLV